MPVHGKLSASSVPSTGPRVVGRDSTAMFAVFLQDARRSASIFRKIRLLTPGKLGGVLAHYPGSTKNHISLKMGSISC